MNCNGTPLRKEEERIDEPCSTKFTITKLGYTLVNIWSRLVELAFMLITKLLRFHLLSLNITNTPVFQEQEESGTFCQMRQLMPLLWWHLQASFNLWYWLTAFIYFLTAGQFARIFNLMELIKIYQVYTRAWRRLFVFASKSMIRLVNILEFFHCSLLGDTQGTHDIWNLFQLVVYHFQSLT